MDPINVRRLSRAKQRERARTASEMLLEGTSARRVMRELGYRSRKALKSSVDYHRRKHGYQRDKGWVKLTKNDTGSVRLHLYAVPMNRCGWKIGQSVLWRVVCNSVVLTAAHVLTRQDVFYDPSNPDSVAYALHRVENMTFTDIAKHLRVSRSEACRMVRRHTQTHPTLPSHKQSPFDTEGVVTVHRHGEGISITLVTPIKHLGWDACDIVRWEYDSAQCALVLCLETSANPRA